MLKGKAKTDYQREYMRKLRLKGKLLDPSVRPDVQLRTIDEALREPLRPILVDADGNPIPDMV